MGIRRVVATDEVIELSKGYIVQDSSQQIFSVKGPASKYFALCWLLPLFQLHKSAMEQKST